MPVYRNKTQQFTTVAQNIIRDENLSLKDLGLLVSLLSLPDNWSFSERGLYAIFPNDGKDSIRTGLKNLERRGYLRRELKRSGGKFAEVEWSVFDSPCSEKPCSGKPNTEKPISENPPQYNTKESITKESITKEQKEYVPDKPTQPRFIKPTVDEVKAYCEERKNNVDAERFVDYYTANGWRVGKGPMKDWKAAVRTWEKGEKKKHGESEQVSEQHYGIVL